MNASSNQLTAEAVWTIPAILSGLEQVCSDWQIYSPKCEPFWAEASKFKHCRRVYDACRGVTLALEAGLPAVIFVPNRQLPNVMNFARSCDVQAPMIMVIEDHPTLAPQHLPRESSTRAGLTVIEPCSPSEVMYCASAAARMSAATSTPTVLVAHHGLLGGSATLDVQGIVEQIPQRQSAESIDAIRLGRKLELNRQRTLPSPGEKISVGFITIGLSDPALKYLVSELQLLGRVPMLNLRLIHPLDRVPVERRLSRCRHVVVLEPRPGEIEKEIITVAQSMLREGGEVAAIWGRELPPTNPEHEPVNVPVDSLHPSIVARLTQHLLHDVKPSAQVSAQLLQKLPNLDVLSTRRTSFGTSAALALLRDASLRILKKLDPCPSIIVDGEHLVEGKERIVYVETWGEQNFIADGAGVVRDANEKLQTRILLVWKSEHLSNTLSMVVDSIASGKSEDQNNVVEVSLDNGEELDAAIDLASGIKGTSIIIVSDSAEPQFDIEKLTERAADIDRRGFRPQHAIVIPIEQMAAVRIAPIEPWQPKSSIPAMPLESSIAVHWSKPEGRKVRVSLRPILERVEVTRSKPPVRVVEQSTTRLTPPQPIHATASSWRVHIAGYRGDQPGVVGQVLIEAGLQMDYEINAQCNSAFVGAGRRAWAQILFTRKQTKRSFRPLIATIPWGESDLLLGWDREEVIRALDPNGSLQIASTDRTHAVINTDPLERQVSLSDIDGAPTRINASTIATSCIKETAVIRSFASLARYRFHNERLGDLIQLGMAFQLGFIPVTVDAIQVAVQKVEKEGFARSIEAFDFGRRLALDPDTAWQPIKEEFQVDLHRLTKRSIRDLSMQGKRGLMKASVVQRLIKSVHQSMPGLMESSEGRQVMSDIVNAIRRCMLWGGEETANLYINTLGKLYAVDSAENGRALTRKAALPLAEAMLIRDPIYLARLARSPEILRRIRGRLNVRHSRGDTLARRFLSRLRIQLWNCSIQIDMRTSDWSSTLVSWIGGAVPKRWRGHKRDRAVREEVVHAVLKAATKNESVEVWLNRFSQLEELVLSGQLHEVTFEEIKKILQE